MTITAKYEDGVFKPLEEVTIKEGSVVEVRLPSCADRLKAKSPSIRDLAFYGMWKDRTDIGESVEYVSLRAQSSRLNVRRIIARRYVQCLTYSTAMSWLTSPAGNRRPREYLDALPEGWAISQVSALELIVGARDNRT